MTRAVFAGIHLNGLVQIQRHHFLHAIFDHLRGEEVRLALFVHRDLAEVLQQDGADGFGGVSHVDRSLISHHLTHVGKSAAMVQMEMAEGTRREEFRSNYRQLNHIEHNITVC